jgi:hypothetical protein
MSGESNMDEVETDIAPDVDGDIGGDDVVSNGDLANRRRRQQVRQACQQCRRRKIKVHTLPTLPIKTVLLTSYISAMKSDLFAGLASRLDLLAPTSFPLVKLVPKPWLRASNVSERNCIHTHHSSKLYAAQMPTHLSKCSIAYGMATTIALS